MANFGGKYKMTVAVEYEIKCTGTELIATLPAREFKKRTRQLKAFTKYLLRLKRKGWQIENIEVGAE